jgi:Na+/alanine symporter
VLLGVFTVIFATSDSGSGLAGRKVFVAIVIYVFAYAVIFALFFAAKKLYAYIFKSVNGHPPASEVKKAPTPYKPRYKK